MFKIEYDHQRDKYGDDFIVNLELPDGLQIKILVPDWNQKTPTWVENGMMFGLNLVSEGHYT